MCAEVIWECRYVTTRAARMLSLPCTAMHTGNDLQTDVCLWRYACCPQPTTSPGSDSTPPHSPLPHPQCPQATRQPTSLPPTSLQYLTPHQTSTRHSQN